MWHQGHDEWRLYDPHFEAAELDPERVAGPGTAIDGSPTT